MNVNSLRGPTIVAACLLMAFSLASGSRAGSYEETTPFVGVRHFHRMTSIPRLLDVNVVEIDPTAPGIDFLVTPSNGAAPGETVAQTTRSFVADHQLQIGINASFYAFFSGTNRDIQGLAASQGDIYSPFEPGRLAALNVSNDLVATIIQSTLGSGVDHVPNVPLYNAVGGDALILADGINVANPFDTSLHPRTAAGVTDDGKLILMTVDGRNDGHSLGVSTPELANLMLQFGSRDAINLDGGGSTTLVFADSTPRVVNIPVGVNNVPGSERSNGNHFGVYAASYNQATNNRFVFSDFASGEAGHFGNALTASGSTEGVLATSRASIGGAGSPGSPGSQRLLVFDDPASDGGVENPNGWFVRHFSGATGAAPASPAANEPRPTTGVLGFWARTQSPNIEVALAIDEADGVTADRSFRQLLVADDMWRRYEWNLDDPFQWEGWFQSDGVIDDTTFTLDSIQLFGPNADAVIYIDDVYHETRPPFAPIAGDFDGDGDVDDRDLGLWNRNFGINDFSDMDYDGFTGGSDFLVWQRHWGRRIANTSFIAPEPRGGQLTVTLALILQTLTFRKVIK